MQPLTKNDDLKIGTILKAARARTGKTVRDISGATGVSERMVRFWERDIRGIGRGKGVERTDEVFSAYELTQKEREEVIRRIALRKGEHFENSLSPLLDGRQKSSSSHKEASEEMKVLIQLMALSPKKRQWVIDSANTYMALGK